MKVSSVGCQAFLVTNLILRAARSSAECPPPWVPSSNATGSTDYISARSTCTTKCNDEGYCCTLGYGGCNKVPCTTGCHIAFFSDALPACYDECDVANDGSLNSCSYTHPRHEDVGDLGFNPLWIQSGGQNAVAKCVGSSTCGCEVLVEGKQNWGTATPYNECTAEACKRGCDYAALQADMYNGPGVQFDLRTGLDSIALLSATEDLRAHINGSSTMSAAEINAARDTIAENGPLLPTELNLMGSALSLVAEYESVYSGLFIGSRSAGGFARESTTDGKELERAMLQVQQGAIDEIYMGTRVNFQKADRLYPSIIAECSSYLEGRKWETADYWPGGIHGLPTNTSIEHTVSMNATYPSFWGREVCFARELGIRPTGIWLRAGMVATVTVPQEVVNDGGFKIQVGASITDNSNKNWHLRNDRITSTYDVKSTTISVANPLGGNIYVLVPDECNLGLIVISIIGGVVKAPYFRLTDLHTTTQEEWEGHGDGGNREAPGTWMVLETNNFLMQVPRRWIYGYGYNHMLALASNYTMSMSGVLEFLGFKDEEANREVLYESVDRHIKAGAYGIGSPQVNNPINADGSGPQLSGGGSVDGQATHWLVAGPYGDDTSFHELGHARLFSKYSGREEADVNLLRTYVMNVKFGVDMDTAFIAAFPRTGQFTIDKAAINWMITLNFANGNEMDRSNTELDEVRYQHRGFASIADLARLNAKGWSVWSDFWRKEHLDYNVGINHDKYMIDDRTIRVSREADEDITPLIHFWGIHPENPASLKAAMENLGLYPSTAVRDQILRYATVVPMTREAFIAHFDEVWPGQRDCDGCCSSPLYGCGWYNANYPLWSEEKALATVDAVHNIVDLYYPGQCSDNSDACSTDSNCACSTSTRRALKGESPLKRGDHQNLRRLPKKTTAPEPTAAPVKSTPSPTKSSTDAPSALPSKKPTTPSPSKSPTNTPTTSPSKQVEVECTCVLPGPSQSPTRSPTVSPSQSPTVSPSKSPTDPPTPPTPPAGVCSNNLIRTCTSSNECARCVGGNHNGKLCSEYNCSAGKGAQGCDNATCSGSRMLQFQPPNQERTLKGQDSSAAKADSDIQAPHLKARQLKNLFSPEQYQSAVKSKRTSELVFTVDGNPPGVNREAIYANMKAAQGKWKSMSARGYSFQLEFVNYNRGQELNGPFQIHVNKGQVTKAVYLDDGRTVPPEVLTELGMGTFSIEGIYENIVHKSNQNVKYFYAEYDPAQGYLQRLAVNNFGSGEELQLQYVRGVIVENLN